MERFKLLKVIMISIITVSLTGCSVSFHVSKNDEIETVSKFKTTKKEKKSNYIGIEKIVKEICSDEIGIRFVGYEGNERTTLYIENLFKTMNLEYVFDESYLNTFQYKYEDFKENGEMTIETTDISNVVGKISGQDSKNAIVITAHFDPMGKGVLDNASGLSTALEIADILKEYSDENKLKQDVIFCMTNAEMVGFEGSRNFLKAINGKYENLYNVNLDCIGLKKGGPLALKNISKVSNSSNLYESIKDQFKKDNIAFVDEISTEKTKWALSNNEGVSDYISFEKKGIPNIHIAETNIEPLPEKENLGPEILDYDRLNNIAKSLARWLIEFDAHNNGI